MSWVTIIWSMTAAASLTLAAIHFLVWWQRRTVWADLVFTLTAVGVAVYAGCELSLMLAETPEQFAAALRWLQVPTWVIVVSLAGFVRLYLRAGRRWLAWSVFALRTLALLLNFLVGQNLNYREVTRLRHIPFLGETVSLGVGVSNPWMLVGQLSLLLLVIFTLDATITVYRRGDRRQAVVTGGSIVFFALTGMAQAVLVLWRMVDLPLTESFFFLGIVVAMGYEMSRKTLRAAQLSDDLRESEARMTLAADAAGFGVWMWTPATNRVWGSERWLRQFGFEPDADVTYEQIFQRTHPDDRARVEAEVRHAVANGGGYGSEHRVTLPDGTVRWIVARGRMYPDPQGNPARFLGATVDITDRKQAEQDLAQQRNELAHLSRLSILGEISGSLAHELNQPLGAILANAQATRRWLAGDHLKLEETRAAIEDIIRDDKRAGEIVHRVRALAKKDAPKSQLLDVNRVVRETSALLHGELVAADVPLILELQPHLPAVNAGHVELQQSLLNLMLNGLQAQQATERSRRSLTITTSHAGGTVTVAVRDHGPGLSPEIASRVFDAFFTTKPGGLGLGLSFCRRIAESTVATCPAENHSDGGAVFSLIACLPAPVMMQTAAIVFVVDDDASMRTGLSRLLRSAGYQCEAFESAETFLRRERHPGVGCLVLDLCMPQVNGLELQERLGCLGYHLPIIFLTGHGDIPHTVQAVKQGAVNFLTKPVDEEALLVSIEEALAHDRQLLAAANERTAILQRTETLSAREFEVMQGVISGSLNKQIAAHLGIAEKTVKIHRGHVMEKMGVYSVAELVRLCESAGIKPLAVP